MSWSSDISEAPRGQMVIKFVQRKNGGVHLPVFEPAKVILATKCGKVTTSHWLPDEQRWLMLAKGEQPVAWHAWPTHPHSSLPSSQATDTAGGVRAIASPAPIHKTAAANARLTTAAPDLLKALKHCVIERSEWLEEARAAISKAEG